jgi:hypothetical protein
LTASGQVGALGGGAQRAGHAEELLVVALAILHQRVVHHAQLEILGLAALVRSHERAARVPGADREHARLLLGMEVAMGLGQRHAGQRLGVGPEIDQLLVVVEDLDHPRVLPGELALEEAQGVVGAELVEQHPVRDVVGRPVAIGGAGGERRRSPPWCTCRRRP